jgi:hypothetical protein
VIHALLNETLRGSKANAGRSSRDNRDFSCKFL